jgi:putative transposase
LGLNRSGFYYQAQEISAKEVALKHRIDEIYTESSFYGSRRITQQLQRESWEVNRKAVQRHMREMGIAGIAPGPNLSRRAAKAAVYPYLLRNLEITQVNQVWGIDITYIRMKRSWMYLVAIMDWHSRYVLDWRLSDTLEIEFVIECLNAAFSIGQPKIMNSDQGSHFTSPLYIGCLKQAEIQISMDGKGRALDNIFVERLWRTVKYEYVYLHDHEAPRDLRLGLANYFTFYCQRRLHQSLGYKTPAEVFFSAKSG